MKIQNHRIQSHHGDSKCNDDKGFGKREGAELDKLMRHGMDAKKLKLDDDGVGLNREQKRHLHDLKRDVTEASHAYKQAAHEAHKAKRKERADKGEGDDDDRSAKGLKDGGAKKPPVQSKAGVDAPEAPAEKKTVDTPTAPTGGATRPGAASSIPPAAGERVVNETIVVKAGEVFDGKGVHFVAGKAIGDGSQGEGQKPLFILEDGATLKNVQISGGDGVHAKGDANLENVWWRDVGEDAFTKKGEGNVNIKGGGALNAADKVFQVNAGGSLNIDGFYAKEFGKFIRQNGGKDFPLSVSVTNSYLDGGSGGEAAFRTDSPQAKVVLSNNELLNIKNDVLAPSGAEVTGAVSRGSKAFSG